MENDNRKTIENLLHVTKACAVSVNWKSEFRARRHYYQSELLYCKRCAYVTEFQQFLL